MDEKLTVLIPLKVSERMAAGLTSAAGTQRKRSEFIREVLEPRMPEPFKLSDEPAANANAELLAKLSAALDERPTLRGDIENFLRRTRRRKS